MKYAVLEFFIVSWCLLTFNACQRQADYKLCEGMVQGTFYHITYKSTENLDSLIKSELARFDKSLNLFDSTSTISQVNRGKRTDVSKDTLFLHVARKALEISRLTDGAFDITVAPLVRLWGFNHAEAQEVSQREIDSVMAFVGYEKLNLTEDGKIEKENEQVEIDCNAIAQGYSCDVVAAMLERHGVKDYLVEIGGEIMAKGKNAKGEAWHVGVSKPVPDTTGTNNELQRIVEINDEAICTSGNYHKFREMGNKTIGHEIDPRTGYPTTYNDCNKRIISATVIAPDAMTADALATACMVMGVDKSEELLKKTKGARGFLIYLDKAGKEQEVDTSSR